MRSSQKIFETPRWQISSCEYFRQKNISLEDEQLIDSLDFLFSKIFEQKKISNFCWLREPIAARERQSDSPSLVDGKFPTSPSWRDCFLLHKKILFSNFENNLMIFGQNKMERTIFLIENFSENNDTISDIYLHCIIWVWLDSAKIRFGQNFFGQNWIRPKLDSAKLIRPKLDSAKLFRPNLAELTPKNISKNCTKNRDFFGQIWPN